MAVLFIGYFSELAGVTILLLPLLFRELSRPRDSIWGALIIIVGLILITGSDRFGGSPAIAVILQALIFGRLVLEVFQNRWRLLTEQEMKSIRSIDRFTTNIKQSFFAFAKLGSILIDFIKVLQPKEKSINKKWIRPDSSIEDKPTKDNNLNSKDPKPLQKLTKPEQTLSPKEENITS